MAEVVTMPKLGFDMAEGVLVRWVIAEGGPVERGNVLAEIETDKATVEVESAFSGVVHKHLVKEGAVLPVGEPIAVIGAAGEAFDLKALLGEAGSAADEAAPAAPAAPALQTPGFSPVGPAPASDTAGFPGVVKASPVARRMAEQEGLELGDDHLKVIRLIRDFHARHKVTPMLTHVSRESGLSYRELQALFGMLARLAGLPKPSGCT